jgi:hypothetical protein
MIIRLPWADNPNFHIYYENSILLLYAHDITLKCILYKISKDMQVNLPSDCKVMQSIFL